MRLDKDRKHVHRIMNCLYVEYVEYPRVTDVCIQQNERPQANGLAERFPETAESPLIR